MSDFEPSGMRIGDAEREEALRSLGEHMSAGRLTVDEYGDRAAKVATARTVGELVVVFHDLPGPRPGFTSPVIAPMPPPAPVRWERRSRGWGSSGPVLPVLLVVIAALVLTRGFALPLLVIPAVLFFASRRHSRRAWAVEPRSRHERRHRGRDWDQRHRH